MRDLLAAWWLLPARLRGNWRMLLVASVGVLAASALLAAAPIYAGAMSELGLQYRLDTALGDRRLQSVTLEGLLAAPQDEARRAATDRLVDARLGWLSAGTASVDRSERMSAQLGTSRPGAPADWAAYVHALGDLEASTTVVEGRLPDPAASPPQVVLLDRFQRHVPLDTHVFLEGGGFDDCQRRPISEDPDEARAEVQCRPTVRLAQRLEVVVVGFVRPRDPSSATWGLFAAPLEVPERPLYANDSGLSQRDRALIAQGVGSLPLLVGSEALGGGLSRAAPLLAWRHRVGFEVNSGAIRRTDIDRALAEVGALRTDLETRLALSPSYALPLAQALEQFRGSQAFNQVPLLILLLQIAGIALYYLVIVSQAVVERESEELGVLGSRGASPGQVAAVHLLEALVIAIPATLIAPFVSAVGVSLLGRTPAFEALTGGALLPTTVTPLAILLAAGGGILAITALTMPVVVASRRTFASTDAAGARPATRSVLQRYYLDLAVVGLAGLLLWELGRRGTVFSEGALGGWSSDPLLLAAPFVFALAVAALLLRLYPPLVRAGAAALALGRGTAVALGLRRAARAPAAYARLLLLLVLSLAVGTFAASYAPTVQAAREDRTRYETGADARFTLAATREIDPAALEAARGTPGIAASVLGTRVLLGAPDGSTLAGLGIDADRLAAVAWFRDDFAQEPLTTLARRLQPAVPPGAGIELPLDATAIEVDVFGEAPRPYSVIWARVRDAGGRYSNIDMGAAGFEGWRTLEAQLPENLAQPLHFTGFLITDSRGVGVQREGSLDFDDVRVTTSSTPPQLIEDFEGRFGWVRFGSARSSEQFERSQQHAHGASSARWTWVPGSPDGRRLLAINAGNVPLAVILSSSAAATLGVAPGDTLPLQLDGVQVPVVIRAIATLFPTLGADPGFVVLNRADLEALADLLETPSGRDPTELWLKLAATDPATRQATIEAVRARLGTSVADTAADATRDIEASRADPTLQASGSGILGAAFTAVLVLSILGFLVSVTARERARLVEVAVLRAVGSSRAELLRSLAVEWGTVVLAGVVVGILLGRRVAGVMMSFLDVTESGSRAVPPFIVQTSWSTVGLGAAALALAIGIGILAVWRSSMRRADARQLRLTR